MSAEAPKKRQNLGRGLSALLGGDDEPAAGTEAAAAQGRERSVRTMPVEHLHPGRYQPRRTMTEDAIADLATSIRDKGVLQPILIRPHPERTGEFEIIAGERRWRAAQLAQLHEVPVIVKALGDRETLEIALVENLQREDLSPIEEADAYRRLMDEFSYTQEQLAGAMGKSRSHVANTLRLLGLPAPVRELVEAGSLSAGHARSLLMAEDPAALARQVVKRGLNVRQTEKLVQTDRGEGRPAITGKTATPPPAKDADHLGLEKELTDQLGLSVEIRPTGKGEAGALILGYSTLEQLDDLLFRLTHGARGRPI